MSIQDFNVQDLTDFVGAAPGRSSGGMLTYDIADDYSRLVLELAQGGSSVACSLRDEDTEYAAIKQSGVQSMQIDNEHGSLLLEGENETIPASRFQTRLVIRPRIEIISHAKILSDTAINEGVDWRMLEEIMGSNGEMDLSGTITFAIEGANGRRFELVIGEEGWSATIAVMWHAERVISSTIEEVQYFNVAQDKQSIMLVAKTGTASCLTRVNLKPEPSFNANLQLRQ